MEWTIDYEKFSKIQLITMRKKNNQEIVRSNHLKINITLIFYAITIFLKNRETFID